MVRQVQASARVPSLSVAVRRADRPLWTFQVGQAGESFRIGSITKTFTAVLVMQCRDEGLINLDDPIIRYLDVPAHGEMTFRRLLSHTGGLQREPAGDLWDTLAVPDVPDLLKDLAFAEAVHPPSRRFHYSNLGFALLGHAAAKVLGGQWWPLVRDRICQPLGLEAITYAAPPNAATGYLVDTYSEHARAEPASDFRAVAPAAQLWSTAADMALWAAYLADPAGVDPSQKVLAHETVDEMRWPLTPRHESEWTMAVGLGLMLWPQGERVLHVGHNGAMPGFLAAAAGRYGGQGNPGGVGAAVLASSGTAVEIAELTHQLINESLTADPMEIKPWSPGEPAPPEFRSVLGRWWGEGFEYVFRWSDGHLTAAAVGVGPDPSPAAFAPIAGETDILRTISGREVGELLRLTRGPEGDVVRMHWATYRFTRHQETFDRVNPGLAAPRRGDAAANHWPGGV